MGKCIVLCSEIFLGNIFITLANIILMFSGNIPIKLANILSVLSGNIQIMLTSRLILCSSTSKQCYEDDEESLSVNGGRETTVLWELCLLCISA